MAGDWIKIRTDLHDDPDVIKMSDICRTKEAEIVGCLVIFFSWANRHTTDGTDLPLTSARIDRLVGLDGFAEGMRRIGWLSGRDGSLQIANYERHNGNGAKARALESEAKQLRRLSDKNTPEMSDKCPTKTPPNVGLEKRRVEKSRIEEKNPLTPKGDFELTDDEKNDPPISEPPGYPETVKTIWEMFPAASRNRSSLAKLARSMGKLRPKPAMADLVAAIGQWQASREWQTEGGKYVSGVDLWIKDRKWETPPAAIAQKSKHAGTTSMIITGDEF